MDNQPLGLTPDLATENEQLRILVQELEAQVLRLTAERDVAKAMLQQSRMARRIPAGRMNMNGRDA